MNPEALRLAKEAKARRRAEFEANPARTFAEEPHWEELASKYKVRLPQRATQITNAQMESFLRKAGVKGADWRAYMGGQSNKQFIEDNPHWTLRAWAGLVLEYREGKELGRFV